MRKALHEAWTQASNSFITSPAPRTPTLLTVQPLHPSTKLPSPGACQNSTLIHLSIPSTSHSLDQTPPPPADPTHILCLIPPPSGPTIIDTSTTLYEQSGEQSK